MGILCSLLYFHFPAEKFQKKKAHIQNWAVWRLNLVCLHFMKLIP